jgi:hypothetical protein
MQVVKLSGGEIQVVSLGAGQLTVNPVYNSYTGFTGEVNTASNVGSGVGLYKEKFLSDLRFKSISGGTGVDIVDGDTIVINAEVTQTELDAKLNTSSFNTYTGATNTALNSKLNTTTFNAYSATTNTAINNRLLTTIFNTYTGTTAPIIKDADATINTLYPYKLNTDLKGTGTITLTNGSATITGLDTNFLTSSVNGLSYWFTLWVKDGSTWYRILVSTITNNTTATISTHYSRTNIRAGYLTSLGSTWTGSNGSYEYYFSHNTSDGYGSLTLGVNSYSDNYSTAIGGSAVSIGYGSFALGDYASAKNNYSIALGAWSESTGVESIALGLRTKSTGASSFAGGAGHLIGSDNVSVDRTKWLLSSGAVSFNFSQNNATQTAGHGANANNSAILGGVNHDIPSTALRSAIIGGSAIKVSASVLDTVHLPKVRIGLGTGGSLTNSNTNYNFLSRNSTTGEIETNTGFITSLNAYTGATNTVLNNKLNTSVFNAYTATTTSGGGTVTGATNGLTLSGATIVLGGALTQNTLLNGVNGEAFTIDIFQPETSTGLIRHKVWNDGGNTLTMDHEAYDFAIYGDLGKDYSDFRIYSGSYIQLGQYANLLGDPLFSGVRVDTSDYLYSTGVAIGHRLSYLHFDEGNDVTFNIGTGNTTGDMYYRNSTGHFTKLPIGSTNQQLIVSGGTPVWATPSVGDIGSFSILGSGTYIRFDDLADGGGFAGLEYSSTGTAEGALTINAGDLSGTIGSFNLNSYGGGSNNINVWDATNSDSSYLNFNYGIYDLNIRSETPYYNIVVTNTLTSEPTGIEIDADGNFDLYSSYLGVTSTFGIRTLSMDISSSSSEFMGLMYDIDYSANFTDRSIPDVGYLHNFVTGITSTISGGTGSSFLSGLTDTSISSVLSNHVIQWNGTDWINKYFTNPVKTVTGTSYTILSTDQNYIIEFTNSASITVTLPNGLANDFSATIVKKGSGNVTISATGTLQSQGTTIEVQHTSITVYHKSSDVWTAFGSFGSAVDTSSFITSSLFNGYTGTTNTTINNKLNTSTFAAYSATTATAINNRLLTTTFSAYSATTNTTLNNKLNTTTFSAYSATTNTTINNKLNTATFAAYTATTNNSGTTAANFIVQESNYTLSATTATQKLFSVSGKTGFNLPTGIYSFNAVLHITSMSATSGNGKFEIKGAGTATISRATYGAWGLDNSTPTNPTTQTGSLTNNTTGISVANILSSGTGTAMELVISGTFRITAAGTIIPSFGLTTAASAIVNAGSFIKIEKLGESSPHYGGLVV